jgi:hypothetical protein
MLTLSQQKLAVKTSAGQEFFVTHWRTRGDFRYTLRLLDPAPTPRVYGLPETDSGRFRDWNRHEQRVASGAGNESAAARASDP